MIINNNKIALLPFADIHTHVLPGIDDGAYNSEEAEHLLDLLLHEGVHQLCFTPHYYAFDESIDQFLARRDQSYKKIKNQALKRQQKTILGCEIYLCEELFAYDDLVRLTYGDTPYVLLEFPYRPMDHSTLDLLEEFCRRYDVQPILAHIDRFALFFNTTLRDYCRALGCLFQINLDVFTAGRKAQRQALQLIQQGEIDFLGTDCHNVTWRSPVIQDTCKISPLLV